MNSAITASWAKSGGGGSRRGEPRGPKSGGLGPSGPIGVYAYRWLKNLKIRLFVSTECTNVTDTYGQTDGQTPHDA